MLLDDCCVVVVVSVWSCFFSNSHFSLVIIFVSSSNTCTGKEKQSDLAPILVVQVVLAMMSVQMRIFIMIAGNVSIKLWMANNR